MASKEQAGAASAAKRLPPNAGKGRVKGVPNKTTALLKDAILKAADKAGGREGLIGYLVTQAKRNPTAFLPLLGKVIPLQVTGADEGPVVVQIMRYGADDPAPE